MIIDMIFLGVSIMSTVCIVNNCYLIECCNIVALKCVADLFVEKKKDLLFHHIMALTLIHYINQHRDIKPLTDEVSSILSTEISTIFLVLNNYIHNSTLNNVNKLAFVITFYYYRIYNYSYLLLDKNVNSALYIYSRNNFEYFEIYTALYGLFLLNIYWGTLILKKIINTIK